MKNIIGIKCKGRIFVSESRPDDYKKYHSLKNLIINGKKPEETFHPDWCVIDNKPVTVQKQVKQPNINHRFELIDKSMESNKIKLVLKKKDVTEYNIEGGGLCWKDEYEIYQSLYTAVSDEQPDILEYVEFEYETVTEVKQVKEYKGFAYDVQKTQWAHEGLKELKENEVQHQLIDKIIFPDILLPARPCSLTSKQSFNIVRQYVKQHINYDVAFITSDYNFCFTVKKKIFLSAPERYTVNVNNLWNLEHKSPSKFREIECFNMAPEKYQNYKIIEGFRGKTQEDLKGNIDSYCRKLIEFINEPVVNCPHCKGRGVIDEETSYEVTKE